MQYIISDHFRFIINSTKKKSDGLHIMQHILNKKQNLMPQSSVSVKFINPMFKKKSYQGHWKVLTMLCECVYVCVRGHGQRVKTTGKRGEKPNIDSQRLYQHVKSTKGIKRKQSNLLFVLKMKMKMKMNLWRHQKWKGWGYKQTSSHLMTA